MNRPALATLLGGILLAGCAVRPPTGPTVLAVPPEGKNLGQFQQEEANCRNYAFNQIGISPAEGANNAQTSSYSLQARYDQAYAQCLASTGNQVQTATAFASPYGYGYYPAYGYPYYSPYFGGFYGPGFYRPGVSIGLGFGIGYRRPFYGHGFRGGYGGFRGPGIRGRR